MNLLHVTPSYYPATYWGGPIFSVLMMNNYLAKNPHIKVKVLTTDTAGPKGSDCLNIDKIDYGAYPDQEVIFTHKIFGRSTSLELILKLPTLIRWANVVHLTATYSFPTLPTLFFCRIFSTPVVWSPRGALLYDRNFQLPKRKILKKIWLTICNAFLKHDQTILHVTSEAEREVSLNQIPKASAVIIKNGVEVLERFPEKEFLLNGKMEILFLGRIAPVKGIENLLGAIKILGDPGLQLSIFGSGDSKYVQSLKDKAKKMGLLGKGVQFFGHVDGEEKRRVFLNADICVFPSYSENFGNVVVEALAHGLPVITSHGMPWESVEEKLCGLWVDNSPESLALALKTIRQLDLAEMGRNGWLWMKDEYGWESVAEKMLSTYKSMTRKL